MSKILLLVRNPSLEQEPVQYALRIAKASGAAVECLHLTARDPSTADWIQSRPQRAIQRLRRIRARQSTAEWVRTIELLKRKEREIVRRHADRTAAEFRNQRITFTHEDVYLDSGSFLARLEKSMPVDLIIGERMRLPAELTHAGLVTIGDLGARLRCTAIDGTIMHHFLQRVPRRVWRHLAVYGSLTAVVYAVLFPLVDDANRFLMGGGVLAAIGIMAAAAAVAWVYGKTVESILKLTKLDVY
jgi:hypothetical protein